MHCQKAQVGTTPANFSPGVFSMIRNVSESVIIPIAGMILTFIYANRDPQPNAKYSCAASVAIAR